MLFYLVSIIIKGEYLRYKLVYSELRVSLLLKKGEGKKIGEKYLLVRI